MKFVVLNSPKRILVFTVIVLILSLSVIYFTDSSMNADGISGVEANVDKQLGELIAQVPSFKGLTIAGRTRIHYIKHSDLSLTGFFEYDAQKGGLEIQLHVNWVKDSTSCQISKIESLSTSSPPSVLWENTRPQTTH